MICLNLCVRANEAVSFPSSAAAWTIIITDSPNQKGPPIDVPKEQKVEATQDGKFLRNLITYSTGKVRDYWSIVGTNVFMVQETPTSVTLKNQGPYGFVPYLPSCFDWVQPGCLQEKAAIFYKSKLCYHYKGLMPFSPSLGYLTHQGVGGAVTGEAWIDSKTLLPVALDDGFLLATYEFKPGTPAPLDLPPGYKSLYDSYKN